jgi:hypothetical protein
MDVNSILAVFQKIDLKLLQSIFQMLISFVGLIAGVAVAFSSVARCVEAWYQLSQTPGLSSWSNIKQWWNNFWSIEKYKTEKAGDNGQSNTATNTPNQ